MKLYVLSLGAGLLVGIVYSLLQVHSPAPLLMVLVGLLNILLGKQVIPTGKQLLGGCAFASAHDRAGSVGHALEQLPDRYRLGQAADPSEKEKGWTLYCQVTAQQSSSYLRRLDFPGTASSG